MYISGLRTPYEQKSLCFPGSQGHKRLKTHKKKNFRFFSLVNLLEFLNFIITYLEEDLHSLLCLPSPEKLNAALHSQTFHIRFENFAF